MGDTATMESGYVFDPSWEREHGRLLALEEIYDDQSRHRLTELGVEEGWHCLEVGCGAASIARWLAKQVGAAGRVLATDLDTRFAHDRGLSNLEIRTHDLLTDELPAGAFDLVHARAVVEHLPDRDEALRRLAAATRPGGWVVVEDFDIDGPMYPAAARYYPPEHLELAERLGRALRAAFGAAGVDPGTGRRLPQALTDAGLTEIGAQVHAPVLTGGAAAFFPLTLRSLRPRLLATGEVSDADIEEVITLTKSQGTTYIPNFMVIAWGRKPF
ncbi:methyltransferase domain-containing protein [Streptomyces sp. NPDC051913]|uniref:methyltransferase domain-containing protein n=1 Tax=Streptomyces sp. NPDC051913 TaxID=3365676 RepID=UPI0037D969ED